MSNDSTPHPTDEGRQAYLEGKPMTACPYQNDSIQAVEWEGGWMEAEENDTE